MIFDSYEIWVCPDRDCEYWDVDSVLGEQCPEHHAGAPPKLVKIIVRPDIATYRRYR